MSWRTYRQDASTTPSWRHHWSKTLLTQRPSYSCKCWLSSARCWLDRGWVVLQQTGETAPPHGCLWCCQVVLQQNGIPRIQKGNCPGDYHALLWKRHKKVVALRENNCSCWICETWNNQHNRKVAPKSKLLSLIFSPGPYVAATSPVGLECLFYAMCKNELLIV